MNEPLALMLAGLAGAALGAFFFGGLWWTVRLGVSVRNPSLWFLASGLLRTGIVVAGLFLTAGREWPKLVAALIGFLVARLAVLRLTRPPRDDPKPPAPEARHAP